MVNGMQFLREVWQFLKARKKFWLLPIMVAMVMLGGLVVMTKGSAIAPFIYTLMRATASTSAHGPRQLITTVLLVEQSEFVR
jgi:hypothetical protein